MKRFAVIALFLVSVTAYAQNVYEEKIYLPLIKSVKMEVDGAALSFPLIELNGDKNLVLKFDELSDQINRYEYRIIHCNADWTQSDLQPMQYIEGFETGTIESSENSFNTLQNYVHYEQVIPSQIKFLLSGNYVIKVFEEFNEDKVILVKRFYVSESSSVVGGSVNYPRDPALQRYNQEVEVAVTPVDGFSFYNPTTNVRVRVIQNGRRDNAAWLKLHAISNQTLDYSFDAVNMFEGGNEFRQFDFTSLRSRSRYVARLDFIEGENQVYLMRDLCKGKLPYVLMGDINGYYYIRNDYDNSINSSADLTSDYAWIHFVYEADRSLEGNYYVAGELSDWYLSEQNKMDYNSSLNCYTLDLYLKQGFYNYQIIYLPFGSKTGTTSVAEGNHSETENDYHVLVYYRKSGDFYDSLIGYARLNTKSQ
ncbi:MAG: DUF5103 domain-containing protein [Bacteroidales bacterium]|jgi:hypothetical protein|nr:DUF5103 domain-containing protein [Bacteroidales bacterium]